MNQALTCQVLHHSVALNLGVCRKHTWVAQHLQQEGVAAILAHTIPALWMLLEELSPHGPLTQQRPDSITHAPQFVNRPRPFLLLAVLPLLGCQVLDLLVGLLQGLLELLSLLAGLVPECTTW